MRKLCACWNERPQRLRGCRLAERETGRKNRDLSAQEVTATLAAIGTPRNGVKERVTA